MFGKPHSCTAVLLFGWLLSEAASAVDASDTFYPVTAGEPICVEPFTAGNNSDGNPVCCRASDPECDTSGDTGGAPLATWLARTLDCWFHANSTGGQLCELQQLVLCALPEAEL